MVTKEQALTAWEEIKFCDLVDFLEERQLLDKFFDSDLGVMDNPAFSESVDAGSIPASRAKINWFSIENGLPKEDGEYICWVRFPKRRNHGVLREAEERVLCLEFAEGTFWIRNAPEHGIITHWFPVNAP